MQYSCTVVIGASASMKFPLRRAMNTPFARCLAEAMHESLGEELKPSGEWQFS